MLRLFTLRRFLIPAVVALFPIFALPASAAHAPAIYWTSQPVRPAETVMVAGEYFAPGTTVALRRLTDIDPKAPNMELAADGESTQERGWFAITPTLITDRNIAFELPQATSTGVYQFRVNSIDGKSEKRLLNAPEPWFFQGNLGDTASPGGWIGVFGSCIALRGALKPRLALFSSGAVAAVVSARTDGDGTDYGQYFNIPKDMAPGDYSLYISNGHGGPAAWVKVDTYFTGPVDTITIRNSPVWPQKVFDLKDEAGSDNDAKFKSAFDKIRANGGGVLQVPRGAYTLTKPLMLPNLTLIRGAGMKATTLIWTADPANDIGHPAALIAGEYFPHPYNNADRRASFSLEDIGIVSSQTYEGNAIFRESATVPSHFTRVSVTIPQPRTDVDTWALQISASKNLTVDGCVFDARSDVFGYYGSFSYIRLINNTFRWRNSPMWLQRDYSHIIYEHNKEIMAGTWAGNGFTKAMNANPGMAIAGYDSSNASGIYIAHNVSSREGADVPDGSIGMTFDGQTGTYCGMVAALDGVHMTLAGPTAAADIYNHPPCRPGAAICVIDGKGAGQWRWVTSADTTSTTHIDIDRPWDIEPDSTSWIGITNYIGKVIFVDNDFSNDPLLQTYFGTHDVIFAENRFGVPGTKMTLVDWADAPMPGWHYQVLDNTIIDNGAAMVTALPAWTTPKDYDGPITGTILYRDNRSTSGGIPFEIEAPAHAQGVIIENNNGLTTLHLDKSADSTGIIRGNAGSNGSPVNTQGSGGLTQLPR